MEKPQSPAAPDPPSHHIHKAPDLPGWIERCASQEASEVRKLVLRSSKIVFPPDTATIVSLTACAQRLLQNGPAAVLIYRLRVSRGSICRRPRCSSLIHSIPMRETFCRVVANANFGANRNARSVKNF